MIVLKKLYLDVNKNISIVFDLAQNLSCSMPQGISNFLSNIKYRNK